MILNKSRLICFSILIFLLFIYELLNFPHIKVYNLKILIDDYIPFIPAFAFIYISFIPFVLISLLYFMFFCDFYINFSVSFIICQIISYIIYIFFQTFVSRPIILSNDIFSSMVLFIYSVDKPYNCFPSLHVSLSTVLLFYWLRKIHKYKFILFLYVVLVIISTLFIKQHYILDFISGIILGLSSFYIANYYIKSNKN
jgi:membrane-associated phospholipid phosphatase